MKRLIRQHAELVGRSRDQTVDSLRRAVITARLLDLADSVKAAWVSERGSSGCELELMNDHVESELERLRVSIRAIEDPAAEVGALPPGFQRIALPLLFLLRGLDELGDDLLVGWWSASFERGNLVGAARTPYR
ncbi:MAG: hypothetical protein ACREOS_06565 [Candidatus Dormibacteraceae bacterium]